MTRRGKLVIVRGLPGSGKSSLARAISHPSCHWEADMYFCRTFDKFGNEDGYDGPYMFDPSRLADAHAWCLAMTESFMDNTNNMVVVSNTFSRLWEMKPYLDLAERKRWAVSVIKVVGSHGSIHSVPVETIARMRDGWEHFPGEITVETCGLG